MAKSPEEMLESMIANLPQTTGKSLEQWLQITKKSGLAKHGEIVKQLKGDYGIGHGYANLIAQRTLSADQPAASGEDLVAAQYAGPKAALMPIHDALIKAAKKLGKDVEVSPKKTCVSLRRNKQFALFQPSTKTRVDLGLCLEGVAPKGRLEAAGSFNAMCSHRIKLEAPSDIDAEVLGWLKQAYELA